MNQIRAVTVPLRLRAALCKIMERMINDRLRKTQAHKLLSSVQCGFRKNRSTSDHLIRLETFVREAFIQRQHAVGVFFDLEKAYDTTWKYGIMRDLHRAGLRGRLPMFTEGFLQSRNFQVRVGSRLYQLYDQEVGVLQGSILSVTLFRLQINSVVKAISPGVERSLYVEDFLICYRSKYIHIIERHIQQCLNNCRIGPTPMASNFLLVKQYVYIFASQTPSCPYSERINHSCS